MLFDKYLYVNTQNTWRVDTNTYNQNNVLSETGAFINHKVFGGFYTISITSEEPLQEPPPALTPIGTAAAKLDGHAEVEKQDPPAMALDVV